jgi:hypothetical protein
VSACPTCGEPAEPGQLVCTNCGTRLALSPGGGSAAPTQASWPALALLLAVVVLGAGAFGFALSEITNGDDGDGGGDRNVAAADTEEQPAPSATPGEPQERTQAEETQTETIPTEEAPAQPRRRLLLDWPEDLSAHTVVLVTTSDRPAAMRLARQAARSGIEAGLLRADDYNLGSDLWIVFAGRFDSRESAGRRAVELRGRYPGAYPQLIEPLDS